MSDLGYECTQDGVWKLLKDLNRTNKNNCNMIILHTGLLLLVGDIYTALILNQILYWQDRTMDPNGWFYHTENEWVDEFQRFISGYQIRNSMEKLKTLGETVPGRKDGVLEVKLKKARGAPVNHYRIRWDRLEDCILNKFANQSSDSSLNESADFGESDSADS